ncbi:hypothetical protein F441_05883 [Phytophthora nicotianae CJ01A1]|uniref:DDE-1 domain-containing protein n=1 Tax=Phytophthora nicotianae CJ01A1 TaxID=1317063 RepID=W2XEI2_PHYNI|nr:hypothetical protein F441_05883 [Phytophthora nicotianae CJ01A1]
MAPSLGSSAVEHTVQPKAWCHHGIMVEWIEKIWRPIVLGCRMLLLDNFKVHKMSIIQHRLETIILLKSSSFLRERLV